MHAPDVPGKVRFLSKLPRTLFTLERPFTGMASLVALRKQLRNRPLSREAMLSLKGIYSFLFVRQASPRREFSVRLVVQK